MPILNNSKKIFTGKNPKRFENWLIDNPTYANDAYPLTYKRFKELSGSLQVGVILLFYDSFELNGYGFAGNEIGTQKKNYYYRINGDRPQNKKFDSLPKAHQALLVELNKMLNTLLKS